MKRIIKITFIAAALAVSAGLYAQTPPPPNGNGSNPSENGNTPVGGGAPIGSGLAILFALGAAYAGKRIIEININKNNE